MDQELRLLPQPLYRYESTLPEVVDGALFTFVTGTDPELMLVIEARRTAAGPLWHFGAGPFSDLPITLRHKRAAIWKYDRDVPCRPDTKMTYLSALAQNFAVEVDPVARMTTNATEDQMPA